MKGWIGLLALVASVPCAAQQPVSFQGISMSMTKPALPPGFNCKVDDRKLTTCKNYDHRGTYLGYPTEELEVNFEPDGQVSSVFTNVPPAALTSSKFIELRRRIGELGVPKTTERTFFQWNMNDGSMLRLVVFEGVRGVLDDKVSIGVFPRDASQSANKAAN